MGEKMEDKFETSSPLSPFNPIAVTLASLAYCYFLVFCVPKGMLRTISLLPVFYQFSIIPWYHSSSLVRGVSSFFITWIASFKLLLFSFDHGPLIAAKHYVDFASIAIFPIKMRENQFYLSPALGLEAASKLVGLALLLLANFYADEDKCPQIVIFLLRGLFTIHSSYVLRSYVGHLIQAAAARYELVPLFNHPYLATSLQDFWGRRWNQLSSNILRQTIYKPTLKTLVGVTGFGPAKVVALITTLVVSGVMHELMFYYITCGKRPSWEMTWFFVIHGLCMVLEGAMKHLYRVKGWKPVHRGVSIGLTIGFVLVTFYWLLVSPVLRSGRNECGLSMHLAAA